MKSTAMPFISSAAMRAPLIGSVVVLAALAGRNQAWANPDPGMVNLAQGMIASATNTNYGGTPDKGVDGNRDGNFGDGSVYYGNSPNSEGTDSNPSTTYFYQVDLGQNDYINRVQFLPRTDAVQNVFGNFNISIYPDDGTGNPATVPSFSHNYNTTYFGPAFATADPGAAVPGGASGRFVRITRLDNNYWLTFAEMEVIGASAPLKYIGANDIALGKPVTTSSPPGFGSSASAGNDGNINGDFGAGSVYHSSNHSTGEYWQVDLGTNTPLAYANLFSRFVTNTTGQFDVEVFDSSMSLVDSVIVNNSDPLGPTPDYDHAIDLTGVTGRYVRVATTTDSFLALSELQVFAAVTVPPAFWTGASGTSWADSGNWSGAVPGATSGTTNTSTAVFNQSASNSPLVIDVGRNLQNITFDTASVNSLTIGSVTGNSLLLTSGGAIQTTSTVVNPQTINAPLILEGDYVFTSGATATAATLTFGGRITPAATSGNTTLSLNGNNSGANTIAGVLTDNGSGVLAVTKDGPGLWILRGTDSYSGPTTVMSGTLRFNIASGTATIAAGATATVASGATLELAGAISALGSAGGNRVHLINNSSAPGLLVTGMHQVVGNVDGNGTMQVNAGSDLRADRIIQSALIIGGAVGSPAVVTIDASNASGNPLDQPSGLALAGSLTPSGPFVAPEMNSASSSAATVGSADLAVLTMGKSVGSDNAAPVPEPSTLLLALPAVLGLAGARHARRRFGIQASESAQAAL